MWGSPVEHSHLGIIGRVSSEEFPRSCECLLSMEGALSSDEKKKTSITYPTWSVCVCSGGGVGGLCGALGCVCVRVCACMLDQRADPFCIMTHVASHPLPDPGDP